MYNKMPFPRKEMQYNGQKKNGKENPTNNVLRRTDNTIAQRQRTTEQTTIYKTLHAKLNIQPLITGGELRCSGRVGGPTPLVTPVVLL
jgi:hypothetical protein